MADTICKLDKQHVEALTFEDFNDFLKTIVNKIMIKSRKSKQRLNTWPVQEEGCVRKINSASQGILLLSEQLDSPQNTVHRLSISSLTTC